MKKFILGALTISSAAWLAGTAAAHGGTYRGPGDTVPPGAGGGGSAPPTTPGPQGPSPEKPQGPTTPGSGGAPPAPGVPPVGSPTTPSSIDTGTDLEAWSFWWEFNKDPFLNLKAKIHSTVATTGSIDFFLGDGAQSEAKDTFKPSEEDIRGKIVPALLKALDTETNNDIITGCLIALAKIGDKESGEDNKSEFSEIIAKFLKDSNQEISETAALSLGILANSSKNNLDRLVGLMQDNAEGRTARGSQDGVPDRTRTFAAYGLGLVGNRSNAEDVRRGIVQKFADTLPAAMRLSTQDLSAAIIISMGLVPLPASGDLYTGKIDINKLGETIGNVDTLEKQIALLLEIFESSRLDRYMRAHVPTALVRLFATLDGSGDELAENRRALKKRLTEVLLKPLDPRKGSAYEEEIRQSVALALGLLGDTDGDKEDVEIRKTLMEAAGNQQRQAKNFALIALAKIGARLGEEKDAEGAVRNAGEREAGRSEIASHLVKRLDNGKAGEEHWAGISIGVLTWNLNEQKFAVDPKLLIPLSTALSKSKAVEDIGAFSVATGIARDKDSSKQLEKLLKSTSEPIAQGYVALALGLLGASEARDDIKLIVEQSEYKPDLLRQAAIALGLLGDKATVPDLVVMLDEAKSLATQASLASALGFIGDKRSVDPLVEMLGATTKTDTARGFAAVALGIVADKEPLPWNSKIAVDLNYRASVSTLNTQDGKGILNIL